VEHPVRVAFCPLLFAHNGGRFDERGRPIFAGGDCEQPRYDSNGEQIDYVDPVPVRGKCNRPVDCNECALMAEWVEARVDEGWDVGWECPDCLKESERYERDNPEVERFVPGFFQAGRSPDLEEQDEDYDRDRPSLPGCTSCGKGTSFLQLVIRRARSSSNR
jgi:hypothetical protein